MKLKSEVDKLESTGDAVRVTLTNIKAVAESEFSCYRHAVSFCIPNSRAKAFPIGRSVTITVKAS